MAAVLLLFALAIFLLYRARNRQLRADSESIASGMGLTRQISAPSIVAVPFEVPPPRSATAAIFNRSSMANNVRRRSYLTDSARGMAAAAAAIQTDGDASSMSSVPARPRNPYEGVVRPDLPIDYPGHMPNSPREYIQVLLLLPVNILNPCVQVPQGAAVSAGCTGDIGCPRIVLVYRLMCLPWAQ